MSQKPGATTGQALKMALKDVGGVVGFIILLAVVVVTLWWLAGAAHAQLLRYYPVHTETMAIAACAAVPVLIVFSEVFIRTRNIAGDGMSRRLRCMMDVLILSILLGELLTAGVLIWMIYHLYLAIPCSMTPVMVVCAIVAAVSGFIRIRTGWAGW